MTGGLGLLFFSGDFEDGLVKSVDEFKGCFSSEDEELDEHVEELEDDERFLLSGFVYLKKR